MILKEHIDFLTTLRDFQNVIELIFSKLVTSQL